MQKLKRRLLGKARLFQDRDWKGKHYSNCAVGTLFRSFHLSLDFFLRAGAEIVDYIIRHKYTPSRLTASAYAQQLMTHGLRRSDEHNNDRHHSVSHRVGRFEDSFVFFTFDVSADLCVLSGLFFVGRVWVLSCLCGCSSRLPFSQHRVPA